jgi:alkylation response protein AidB-like acyl-CoA dehydrogenase
MGLVALAVPEKYDGLGQTAVDTCVVMEELGRGLYFGPYLACVGLAVPALLASGDESACTKYLPAIAAGELVATVAVTEADGRFGTGSTATEAVEDGDGWRLTGTKPVVLDGADAGLLLVTARTGDSDMSLFAVDGDPESGTDGVTRTRLESLDLARSVARVDLENAPATLVGQQGAAPALVADVLDAVLVAMAAEQAGGAAACLELSVEYAKTRQQFNRAIGSFQAVAHKLVDMLHSVEFSRAAARYAAAAAAEGDAEAPVACRVAAAYCGDAFRAVTVETVHTHGGTGFTWEHDAHLYYRRAWSSQHLFAGPGEHHAAIAERIGL